MWWWVHQILDFDVKTASSPTDIAWCGDDSLLLAWRNTGVLMVGPYGHWLSFPYSDGAPHLVPEPDGCRVLSAGGGCELLQRISPAAVSIRSVGSTHPAALLFDAMEAFEEGDPKSDDNIRSISASNQMLEAIDSCIKAAAGEIDVGAQQSFLRAASYGKAFCPEVDPAEFVDTALKLRVLNDVRKPAIGENCRLGSIYILYLSIHSVMSICRAADHNAATSSSDSRGARRPARRERPPLLGPQGLRALEAQHQWSAHTLVVREDSPTISH